MDGVSSAFAVVSLAFQLVDTVQRISKFTKDLKDAPVELPQLSETLDRLTAILVEVRSLLEQQASVPCLSEPNGCIFGALKYCKTRPETLEHFVHETTASATEGHRMQMVWASRRLVFRKECQ